MQETINGIKNLNAEENAPELFKVHSKIFT
jgi:hypothetical protein